MNLSKGIKNKDYKNVFTLMSGTTLSQLIPIVATVFLARLYSSVDFGEVELFLKLSSFLIVVSTLRYEMAIPLPKLDKHAFYLFNYTFRWNVIFLLLFQTILLIAYLLLNPFLGEYQFGIQYLWLPIFVFFMGYSVQAENWALRKEKFGIISISRIMNSIGGNVSKITFGLFGFGSLGLILGNIVGAVFGAFTYFKTILKSFRDFNKETTLVKRKASAIEFREFASVNAPHAIVDMSRDLVLISLITYYFGLDMLGFYAFSIKILRMPISFIGVAVGQVYYQKASKLLSENKSIYELTLRNVRDLFLISVIPTLLLFFFGQEIFVFVFGESWRVAGYLAEINAPVLLVIFISSPLSRIPMLMKQQKIFFFYSTLINVGYILLMVVFATFYSSVFSVVWVWMCLFQFITLFFIVLWFIKLAKQTKDS